MSMDFGKVARRRLSLATVPRESDQVDRLIDNSRQMIRLDRIVDNASNPRTSMDDAALRELAASIAEHGLLQAPVVRRHPEQPDHYLVVLGARRVAAHRLLGREEVEVIVRRLDDQQSFLALCVENLQRVALTGQEELDLVGVLIETLGSQEAAAQALAKSPTWISKRKRVLTTPVLASAVAAGEITLDHAYDVLTRAHGIQGVQAHLAWIRAGVQSQEETRETGRSQRRKQRVIDPLPEEVSDRNLVGLANSPLPRERDDSLRGGVIQSEDLVPEAVSDRNSPGAAEEVARVIALDELAIIRLERSRGAFARRDEVLAALRADVEQIVQAGRSSL
jgi:ParB/RepB/Spo0J family partition protein